MTGVTSFSVDKDEHIDGELLDAEGNLVDLIPIGTTKQVDCLSFYAAGADANLKLKKKQQL